MKNSECRIGRRDFLKSCGMAVAGLPVIAVSATFPEASSGFVPAVFIPAHPMTTDSLMEHGLPLIQVVPQEMEIFDDITFEEFGISDEEFNEDYLLKAMDENGDLDFDEEELIAALERQGPVDWSCGYGNIPKAAVDQIKRLRLSGEIQ